MGLVTREVRTRARLIEKVMECIALLQEVNRELESTPPERPHSVVPFKPKKAA